MIWQFDVLIFLSLIVVGVLALRVRDLLGAVALFAVYSVFAALLFAGALAVDVALVEAVLGAGVTGVLFVAAVLATSRRVQPVDASRRRWATVPVILVFLALMVFASTGLPDRGDPTAPAQVGVSTAYLEGSVEQTRTPNVVTALLADYRGADTLGETLVILTAAFGAAVILRARNPEEPA